MSDPRSDPIKALMYALGEFAQQLPVVKEQQRQAILEQQEAQKQDIMAQLKMEKEAADAAAQAEMDNWLREFKEKDYGLERERFAETQKENEFNRWFKVNKPESGNDAADVQTMQYLINVLGLSPQEAQGLVFSQGRKTGDTENLMKLVLSRSGNTQESNPLNWAIETYGKMKDYGNKRGVLTGEVPWSLGGGGGILTGNSGIPTLMPPPQKRLEDMSDAEIDELYRQKKGVK
jgi:hypothetical protein